MPEVFVGAGSNTGPERALELAVHELKAAFGAVRCSSLVRSAAVGVAAAEYLNLVVAFPSDVPVDALRSTLSAIEKLAGRSRLDAAVCELDLDLLLYGARVDAAQRLPRPGSFELPFVLGPLAELAPELAHPVTGETALAAWSRADRGALERIGPLR